MSNTAHCSISGSENWNILDVEEVKYFVVDRDVSKDDRRCDGKFMSEFFTVVERSREAMSNVRQSNRVIKKRDLAHTLRLDSEVDPEMCNVDVGGSINVGTVRKTSKKRHSATENMNRVILSEEPECTEVGVEEHVSCNTTGAVAMNVEVEDFDISTFGRGLRWPEDGIRCAGRKGTTRLLWLHEYFVVN
jgi:hypothetical protein